MKKFIISFLIFLPSVLIAQITITDSDMPVANDTVRWSTTFDQWSIDATETGANYTWDYSFLTETSQELDTFFTVSSTPFAYQLFFNNQFMYPDHKASFATRGQDFDLFGTITMTNVFDYFKVASDQFSNVGFGANINGLPASIRNIPVDTIYKFPLNYQDIYTSSSEWIMSVPNTFTYGQSKHRSVEVEGWGTLISPLGTFPVVKIKMDVEITDTMSIDSLGINFSFPRPVSTEYHWLTNGYRQPLLTITTSFNIITGIKYQDSLQVSPASISENSTNEVYVYPNPGNDYIFISSENGDFANEFQIFDINGKLVKTQKGNGLFLNAVSVTGLPSGLYTLVSVFKKDLVRTKITVTH